MRWWLEHEAPKGKPGRAPLAATTLQGYRINVERHLVPALGQKRVGQLTVSGLDTFASRKLAEGYAPSTVNRMRETLRSALSTAVRQDRLGRNVARYGGGVGAAPPPVDRFSDEELGSILRTAQDEHYDAVILLLTRTGLRIGEACGLRWRDVQLRTTPPRLTVVWQLDKWGQIVDPKSPTSRRTIPLREEVVSELVRWRDIRGLVRRSSPGKRTEADAPARFPGGVKSSRRPRARSETSRADTAGRTALRLQQ